MWPKEALTTVLFRMTFISILPNALSSPPFDVTVGGLVDQGYLHTMFGKCLKKNEGLEAKCSVEGRTGYTHHRWNQFREPQTHVWRRLRACCNGHQLRDEIRAHQVYFITDQCVYNNVFIFCYRKTVVSVNMFCLSFPSFSIVQCVDQTTFAVSFTFSKGTYIAIFEGKFACFEAVTQLQVIITNTTVWISPLSAQSIV